MKTILILTIYLSIFQTINSQNLKFEDICEIACANFDNINKKYTKVKKSKGFNFNTMKEENINIYKNVFVNSYYNDKKLVKIEIIDTLDLGRNIDFDIIYKSDHLYLATIFFWDNSKRNYGNFSSGIFINNKIRKTSYFVEREYINMVIDTIERERPKMIFPFKTKPEYFCQFVSSIKVLDKNLFVKYNLSFYSLKLISFSCYKNKTNKIIENKYIIKDKNFPYLFLEKYTIDDIYKLFSIIFFQYKYQKNTKKLTKIPPVYFQNKPIWFF